MKRQRGVVLLLALVLSLLLGLLTASALRDALVETRMAGYLRDGLLAFEEAETTLQAGADELLRAPPGKCQMCLPPPHPHDLTGQWQRSSSGYFQVQHLGMSTRVAYMPEGQPVALYRVTAVRQQAQARQVLEAVYAVAGDTIQRITWRQRLRGD